jgi:hypothetical protein
MLLKYIAKIDQAHIFESMCIVPFWDSVFLACCFLGTISRSLNLVEIIWNLSCSLIVCRDLLLQTYHCLKQVICHKSLEKSIAFRSWLLTYQMLHQQWSYYKVCVTGRWKSSSYIFKLQPSYVPLDLLSTAPPPSNLWSFIGLHKKLPGGGGKSSRISQKRTSEQSGHFEIELGLTDIDLLKNSILNEAMFGYLNVTVSENNCLGMVQMRSFCPLGTQLLLGQSLRWGSRTTVRCVVITYLQSHGLQ